MDELTKSQFCAGRGIRAGWAVARAGECQFTRGLFMRDRHGIL
jgi:hypothetical protein